MVECNLPKVEVAGSNPVSRSSSWDKGFEGSNILKMTFMKIKNFRILSILVLLVLSGCSIRLIPPLHKTYPKKGRYHTVRKGENLYRISLSYGVTVEAIKKANYLRSNRIHTGQKLFIPGAKSGVKKAAAKKKEVRVAKKVKKKQVIVKSKKGDFLWPARGEVIRKFAKGNSGINILLPPETKIIASKKGKINYCRATKDYGVTIIIDHQDGYYTVYAHNLKALVEEGENVVQGSSIARMKGKEESFLHFEIRKGTEAVDPLPYLED